MKPYPKYKDSGIQWIGQIPENWKVQRIKGCLTQDGEGIKMGPFGSSLTGKVQLSMPYKVYGQWNVVGGDFCAGTNTISEETYQELIRYKVEPNELLISMMGTIGKCAIIPDGIQDGIMDSHIVKVRLNNDVLNSKFFLYVYDKDHSNIVYNQIQAQKRGSIMDGLNSTIIKNLYIPLPPLFEQQVIVAYLDDKTSKLDECVRLLELQKADLMDYRKAIITKTVTRGLNPNAKLKDSGISWIGQIPETWKINRIKHFSKIQTGNTPSTAERRYFDGNVNWFTPGDFKGTFVIDTSARKLSQDAVNNNACRIFPANSIYLIGIGGTLGKIAFSEKEASANQQIIVISPNETIISKYIAYFLSTKRNIFELMANAATLPILSNGSVANMDVPIPPLSEQQEIVEYLDTKTAKIDEAIKRIDEQIADLRAYRAALISDVVTGKIDVRN